MKIGDEGVNEQAYSDIGDHPKTILARLGHVAGQRGTVAQLNRWRIEGFACPIPGKRYAEDQENCLRRIEECVRMCSADFLRRRRKTQDACRQQHQENALEHVPLQSPAMFLSGSLCRAPSEKSLLLFFDQAVM